jgi:hypothetical protein
MPTGVGTKTLAYQRPKAAVRDMPPATLVHTHIYNMPIGMARRFGLIQALCKTSVSLIRTLKVTATKALIATAGQLAYELPGPNVSE